MIRGVVAKEEVSSGVDEESWREHKKDWDGGVL
jgi:hypothetical protein